MSIEAAAISLILEWCAGESKTYSTASKKACIETVSDCTIVAGKLEQDIAKVSKCIHTGIKKLKRI